MDFNKSHRVTLILLLIIALLSCGTNSIKEGGSVEHLSKSGQELLMTNCVTCHSPTAGMGNRLAPPMIAIKRHYIDIDVSQKQFTDELLAFLTAPSEAKSKMPGAVKKYGLMAKLGYTEEEIRDVAEYIYHAELDKPDWFEKHYQEERGNMAALQIEEAEASTDQGLKYAMDAQAMLGKNLMRQINIRGTNAALRFCNEKAIQLTDSMAKAQAVKIKRVSDLPRNPDSRASERELDYIKAQKERLANGEKTQPLSFESYGHTFGYYPIITHAMCLQCHGVVGEKISPEVAVDLQKYYPQDKATGYSENQLRGIWVVEME